MKELKDKVCFSGGSRCFHKVCWQPWSTKPGGYHRSLCGVIDYPSFDQFWVLDKSAERFRRRVADGRLRPCKLCYGSSSQIKGVVLNEEGVL